MEHSVNFVNVPGAMTTQLSLSVCAERFFLVVISRIELKR